MKVGAHPLLVAVALGLLGPNALAAESERESDRDSDRLSGPCEGCDCGVGSCAADLSDAGKMDALSFGLVSGDELGFVMTDLADALAAEAALVLT